MTGRISSASVLGAPGRRHGLIFATLLLAQSIVLVTPEIIDLGLNMIIDASSEEVHFVRGFLQAPASIDISNIKWITDEVVGSDAYGYGDADDATDEDDEFYLADDAAYDTTPPSFFEQETDFPASDQQDFAEDNSAGENEDIAHEGGGGDDEKDVEEENVNGEENVEPSDTTISSEDKENNAKDADSDSENVSEPLTPVIGPGDINEIDGNGTSVIEENDNIEDKKDKVEGNDGIAEEPADESTSGQNPDDENNDDGYTGDKEGEIINEEEDDVKVNQEEQVPGIPSEQENDIEGVEENRGKVNEEGDDDEDDQEEEKFTLTPSGDKNGNDEVDGEGGNSTEIDKGNEQNDGGGEGPNENQTGTVDGASATEKVTKESTSAPTGADNNPTEFGGDRSLQDTSDEASTTTNQILDIALFLIPADCKRDEWGDCDWVALGVGSYDDEMEWGMSYCCSKDTADRGICNSDDIGTMMINHENFKGDHRNIEVPSQPFKEFQMDDPFFDVQESGNHVLVIANCNDDGFGIKTIGNMEWKSVGGYLPGDMFGLMFFYGATTAVYLVLVLWYYYGTKIFQEAAIPIQRYILCTILLGFLVTAFRGIDLFYWNITGMRSPVVMYIALALGTLFQGCLRCLGVMVAMGWGVVRDTLGMTLGKIILLGLLYSGLSLLRDSLVAAASSAHLVSSRQEEEYGLAQVLYFVIIFINIVFYYWIITSVKSTTDYLKNMNQTSKLRRHLRLRCLIITSLIIISILTAVNALQYLAGKSIFQFRPFLSEDQTWIIDAMGYGNYLFILFGVAILWRPNAQAKDYAMQIQLPAVSDDANDLELSCVVPSADDMDMGEGYKIDDAVVT